MFQPFLTALLKGLEAFLIIAVVFAYLKHIQCPGLVSSVLWGMTSAFFVSAGLGFLLHQTANEPLWEGIFGLTAAVLTAGFAVRMRKQSSDIKSKSFSPPARWSVFFFTVFMIAREGMETALLLIQAPQKIFFSEPRRAFLRLPPWLCYGPA